MKRFFWMRSLTGQLTGLLLLALVVSQAIFFLLYRSERESLVRNLQRDEFLAHVASVTRLVTTTEAALHPEILRAASTTLSRYWLTTEAPVEPVAWQGRARDYLLRALPAGPLGRRGAETEGKRDGEKERQGDGETEKRVGERDYFVTNPRFTDADLRVSAAPSWETLGGQLAGPAGGAAAGARRLERPRARGADPRRVLVADGLGEAGSDDAVAVGLLGVVRHHGAVAVARGGDGGAAGRAAVATVDGFGGAARARRGGGAAAGERGGRYPANDGGV